MKILLWNHCLSMSDSKWPMKILICWHCPNMSQILYTMKILLWNHCLSMSDSKWPMKILLWNHCLNISQILYDLWKILLWNHCPNMSQILYGLWKFFSETIPLLAWWLNQMRFWLVIRRSWVQFPQGLATFFHGGWSWNICYSYSLFHWSKKGNYQFLVKGCAQIFVNHLEDSLPRKIEIW